MNGILNAETERQIQRFLLGEFKSRHPSWDDETVEMVETELVDQYLRGELAPSDRYRFESHYLAQPDNRKKVAVAAAFHRWVSQPPRRPSSLFKTSVIALAATLALAIVYWEAFPVTLYPGILRDADTPSPVITRLLPRRIRVAVIKPVPSTHGRAILLNSTREVWRADLHFDPNPQYLTISLPTPIIPPGSYVIALQAGPEGNLRSVASYPLDIR